ncbi:hypothetical protein DRO35_04080 [Candidatus Bathyarchaeota archaeon]|nr:MAG: hypothetical protein DRO35_04080 [Candidatus Bathyarchaeota archaeon]
MEEDEKFEAISHPLRIKILESLSKRAMGFSELKRELGIESSGKLDFHLKKLEELVTLNKDGRYTLTRDGYSALQAVTTIRKYGWQRRAYMLSIVAYVVINAFSVLKYPSIWMMMVFPISTAWIVLYSYWSILKRKIFKEI